MNPASQTADQPTRQDAAGLLPLAEAFTLMELLLVVAVLGVLAALLSPVLTRAKGKAQATVCVNNLKQMTAGWTMYSGDHHEKLMLNGSGYSWIGNGYLTWGDDPVNTNRALLLDPAMAAMARYVKSAGVYKCPADIHPSAVGPRVRSVAMNGALNNKPTFINKAGRTYFTARKQMDLRQPGPARVFVFLDEHPDSIDDGIYMVDPGRTSGTHAWRNLPASLHGGAGSFGFADGHVESHPWEEVSGPNRTVYPVTRASTPANQPWNALGTAFTSRDYRWITDRMPYRTAP